MGRELTRAEIPDYRSAVARCNYLAADLFEIAFATKELCMGYAQSLGRGPAEDEKDDQIP